MQTIQAALQPALHDPERIAVSVSRRLPPHEPPQTARCAEGSWAARPAESASSEQASTLQASAADSGSEWRAGGRQRATDTGMQLAAAPKAEKAAETKEDEEYRANNLKNRELRDETRRAARQAGASPATMRKLGE